MYTALYRAYRPEVFEELLGQEHISKILKNQIQAGTTSHAYLFCGTRGTGKTTTARLLAKGLNCLSEGPRPCGECAACKAIRDGNFLDVVEIDAASNRSIDDIRELRDSVNYPPAVGRSKVYIIDEVHMLTGEAFNALLKTLEEPPEYVTFILATTEPRKLPATILSRCLRLDFKRVPEAVLMEGMQRICRDIGIEVTPPALRVIAANADGSVRDGLSILDQCISGGDKVVDAPQVLDFLGASGEEVFIQLTDLVTKGKTAEAIECLARVLADGKDVRQLIRDWIGHYRNLLMTKFIRDPQGVISLSAENIDRVREQSSVMELEDINRGIMELSKTADAARFSSQPRILLEVCIVNLCQSTGRVHPRGNFPPRENPQRPQAPAVNRSAPAAPQQPAPPAGRREPVAGPAPVQPQPQERPALQPDDAGAEAPDDALDGLDALIAAAQNAGNSDPAFEEPLQQEAPLQPESPQAGDEHQAGMAEAASPAVQESAAGDPQDLVKLWDEVFADGERVKGSIYLIRSNGMLTDMDEHTFTVTVGNDLHKKQTENNRKLLEDLMEARTGTRRIMQVIVGSSRSGEISAEEAAARASEVLGTRVGIEE